MSLEPSLSQGAYFGCNRVSSVIQSKSDFPVNAVEYDSSVQCPSVYPNRSGTWVPLDTSNPFARFCKLHCNKWKRVALPVIAVGVYR